MTKSSVGWLPWGINSLSDRQTVRIGSGERRKRKSTDAPCFFLVVCPQDLLRGRSVAGHLVHGHVLRRGEIARHSIFVHRVDHHFKERAVAAGIELQR